MDAGNPSTSNQLKMMEEIEAFKRNMLIKDGISRTYRKMSQLGVAQEVQSVQLEDTVDRVTALETYSSKFCTLMN